VVTNAEAAFDALGDPQRREILRLLGTANMAVHELASELPISRPAVSRHLRVLKEAGLVDDQPDGAQRIYRLRDDGDREVRAYLETLWGSAAGRFRLVAENTTNRTRP
jgi:DNA-binding transcriptional ArsR family regulator